METIWLGNNGETLSENLLENFLASTTAQYYVRKNYILTQWCRKIDGSQSRLPWHLLTPNLNCAKHNARSKHVEPHLESSYASRSTSRSSLQLRRILVHGSFLCQAPYVFSRRG